MLVSTTTLELAMRRILSGCDAVPGTRLPYAVLESDWRETGLRLTDLRDLVRMMVSHGDLECIERKEGLVFRLTGNGYQHFFQPRVPFERTATYAEDCEALERARRRPRPEDPRPLPMLRRLDDIETA